MANVFGQHGLATGNNDGTSWEDAYQTIGAFLGGLSNNDVGYFKEHAGADLTTGSEFGWVYDTVTIYFGMPSSHTGTNTTTTGRTGYTRFYSNSSHDFRFAFFYGTSSNSLYIDRLWLYDFHKTSFEGAGIQSFNHGSTTIKDCIFDTCTATSGGALSWSTDNTTDSIDVINTRFVSCEGYDGAAVKVNNAELTMVNCSIELCDNSGTANSIIGLSSQTLASFVGCTIKDCASTSIIGGTRPLYVANSIVYSNTGTITAADSSSFIYSDIDATIGGTGHTTTGLIDVDPVFIDTGDTPASLSASSPSSVTSGGNTGVTGYVATDILYVDRDSSPSMGAYEYVVTGLSLDGDGDSATATPGAGTTSLGISLAGDGDTATATQGAGTVSIGISIDGDGDVATATEGNATASVGISIDGDGDSATATPGAATIGASLSLDGDGTSATASAGAATPSVYHSGTGDTATATPGAATVGIGIVLDGDGDTATAIPGITAVPFPVVAIVTIEDYASVSVSVSQYPMCTVSISAMSATIGVE